MQGTELIQLIMSRLGSLALSVEAMKNEDVMILVDRDRLASVAEKLKDDPELRFTTLMNHLGVDYRDRMAVIYNLYSAGLRRKVTLKAFLDRDHPEVSSLEQVFRGISWYERETYDLLGIRFIGHSNLKRLLLPEDWVGHPLRKDYVYPDTYRGIETGRKDLLNEGPAAGEAHV